MTAASVKAAPAPSPAADATPRGWPGLRCPFCGTEDAVAVSLADGALRCSE